MSCPCPYPVEIKSENENMHEIKSREKKDVKLIKEFKLCYLNKLFETQF